MAFYGFRFEDDVRVCNYDSESDSELDSEEDWVDWPSYSPPRSTPSDYDEVKLLCIRTYCNASMCVLIQRCVILERDFHFLPACLLVWRGRPFACRLGLVALAFNMNLSEWNAINGG